MAMKGFLRVDILGASFEIEADEDSAYLQALLNYYKNTVKSVENKAVNTDSLKTSILAGLLLVDELYQERLKNSTKQQEDMQKAELITKKMIEKMLFLPSGKMIDYNEEIVKAYQLLAKNQNLDL